MTKIDIISGFLGAGKTTFIKKLLEEAIAGEQVVLIENEFGQIGIDGGFLKNSGIEIREMNSGCICCSLVGDFGKSLEEVLTKYQPDRVIIEPSGVGKLSDVMKAVRDVASTLDVVLNSAVTIVDASKCKMYMKNFGEFFNNQIENAGTVVLSRTDVVDAAKVQQDVELIREHNASASIVTTPCSQLSGAQLLEIIEKPDTMAEDLMREVEERRAHEAEHDHEHHHHHHDDDDECECGCHDHEHHHHHDDDDDECGCGCHDHDHEHHHHHDDDDECECGCHDHDHEHHHHHDDDDASAGAAATIMTMSIITMITTMTATVAVTIMITIITITMQMRSSQAGAWRMWLLARKKSWRHFYRICLRVMFTDRFSVQRV